MKKIFEVKPQHWYQYLQPSFYKRKKILEDIVNEKEIIEITEKLFKESIITGMPINEEQIEKILTEKQKEIFGGKKCQF